MALQSGQSDSGLGGKMKSMRFAVTLLSFMAVLTVKVDGSENMHGVVSWAHKRGGIQPPDGLETLKS